MNAEQKKLIEATQEKLKELRRILPEARGVYASAASRKQLSPNTAWPLAELRRVLDTSEKSFDSLLSELHGLTPADFVGNGSLTRFIEIKGKVPAVCALAGYVAEIAKRVRWNLSQERNDAPSETIAAAPSRDGGAPLSIETRFDARRRYGI